MGKTANDCERYWVELAINRFQDIIAKQCEEIEELKNKIKEYDRLMLREAKTLKELANFFKVPVAMTYDGEVCGFDHIPYLEEWSNDDPFLYWDGYSKKIFVYNGPINYNGAWEDSLTIPDELEI